MAELQLDRNPVFIERQWRVQRSGWIAMALAAAAAVLGLFGGDGLISQQRIQRENGLELSFDRFAQMQAPNDATLTIPASLIEGDTVDVWVALDTLQTLEINLIAPEPEAVIAAGDRVIYTFATGGAGQPITLMLHYTPTQFGIFESQLGVGAGDPLRFTRIVYP